MPYTKYFKVSSNSKLYTEYFEIERKRIAQLEPLVAQFFNEVGVRSKQYVFSRNMRIGCIPTLIDFMLLSESFIDKFGPSGTKLFKANSNEYKHWLYLSKNIELGTFVKPNINMYISSKNQFGEDSCYTNLFSIENDLYAIYTGYLADVIIEPNYMDFFETIDISEIEQLNIPSSVWDVFSLETI